MTNNPESNENQSKMYALFYSFFLIPFMLAIFGALFFFMFQFLTYEKNTPIDLLNNIQSGSATKRWQSAFELSNMLTPDKINDKSLFENKLKDLFEKSKHDDSKVRTYLALAMGKTKNESFGNVLLDALNDEDKFVRIAGIKSLGLLKYESSCDKLAEIIRGSDENAEKLAAIISLGMIGDTAYSDVLVEMLESEEPNLRWDSGIALIKMNNSSGVPMVEKLLKRDYYKAFPAKDDGSGLDLEEIENSLFVAIAASRIYIDNIFKDELIFLSRNDRSIKVREFALKTIDEYYK